VTGTDGTTDGAKATHRIVVGVDGSDSSLQALQWAAQQAVLTGATLEAVITWEWPATFGWAVPLPPDYDPGKDARKLLDQSLEPVRSAHPDLKVLTTVAEGHPSPKLLAASKGAELLVVGSRGHGEFAGMLIGSVSEHCAAHADCPVLVFRGGEG